MTLSYTYIIIAFVTSLVFSLVGTPFVVMLCNKHKLYDTPNARKLHREAIPRMGGTLFLPSLAIGVSTALLIQYGDLHKDFQVNLSACVMLTGALIIYLIGILDDLKNINATHKFIIQTLAAMFFPLCNLMINNLHGIFGIYEIPLWASYPLTVFVILLIVNAMNLIDGIDGLASSLAFLILISYAYLYHQLGSSLFSLISISLAGALLAFFFFNFYGKVGRLKTFMGDSGSLFLGYVIAYLAIKYQMSNEANGFPYREESLLISFTLVFLPCIDVIRVALMRKLRGKDMFEPDQTHIHHKIMHIGLDQHQTLGIIITLTIIFGIINWGLYIAGLQTVWIIITDIILYSLFMGGISQIDQSK